MKKAIYNHKLRYLAIILVVTFALIASAGYGVTALSLWWERQQNSRYAADRMEAAGDYAYKVIPDTKAVVLNKNDGIFYYETALGFVPVENLTVTLGKINEDEDVIVEDLTYSLNTSGGSSRYVRDADKSETLDIKKPGSMMSVGLVNGERFYLNSKLIEKYEMEESFATDYVYYTRAIPEEEIFSAKEYVEKKEGQYPDKKISSAISDEEVLYRYVESLVTDSGMDLTIAVAATIIGILLAIYVVAGAGHFGSEEVCLTAFDRCGLSIFLAALAAVGGACVVPAYLTFYMYRFKNPWLLLGFAVFALIMLVLCLGWAIESIAVRIKAHSFFSTTTIYYIFCGIKKPVLILYHKLKDEIMTYREKNNGIAQIAFQTEQIVKGEIDSLSTAGVCERYHPLVDSINAIAQGKSNAVSDKLRSDRMRTELITNVSHDIKTPLTSIISYVELLEKEGPGGENAGEYIEVLKRQSLRLKNLLGDLIEASKAEAGVLPVNNEEVRLGVIVNQVLAEYDEGLSKKHLSCVTAIPEEEKPILTDGRHLSRVIGNLLSNIAKYSLEGTRVYIDVNYNEVISGARASITFKNTSEKQLNISSAELMERFVRGDESRGTEGSGLGLSIAGSLMRILGGDLDITIDGDLFKVTVIL